MFSMSYLQREFDGTYAILQVSGFSFGEELWVSFFHFSQPCISLFFLIWFLVWHRYLEGELMTRLQSYSTSLAEVLALGSLLFSLITSVVSVAQQER